MLLLVQGASHADRRKDQVCAEGAGDQERLSCEMATVYYLPHTISLRGERRDLGGYVPASGTPRRFHKARLAAQLRREAEECGTGVHVPTTRCSCIGCSQYETGLHLISLRPVQETADECTEGNCLKLSFSQSILSFSWPQALPHAATIGEECSPLGRAEQRKGPALPEGLCQHFKI